MVEKPLPVHVLGTSGEFFSVDGDIVAAVELRFYTKLFKSIHYWKGVPCKVKRVPFIIRDNEGIVKIAEVMVHGTSSGYPPDDMDTVFLGERPVHFLGRVLKSAHDDGRFVLPEEEIPRISRLHRSVQVFFHCKVEHRVVGRSLDIIHVLSPPSASCKETGQGSLYKIYFLRRWNHHA